MWLKLTRYVGLKKTGLMLRVSRIVPPGMTRRRIWAT